MKILFFKSKISPYHMIKSLLKRLPITKNLIQKYEDLKSERNMLIQQLKKLKPERTQFIKSLYRDILEREPSRAEVANCLQANLSDRELLYQFTNSEEYKRRLRIPGQNNSLLGILTQYEKLDTYLLYPSFDRVQLPAMLEGEPFQLSDFNICLDFLSNHHLLDPQKKVFLDIGANVGSTSVYAIKSNIFTRAISIEPSQSNYQFLVWNIRINDLVDKIYPLHYGIADFVGEQDLIGSISNCGDFRLSPNLGESSENLFNEKEFGVERVQFFTLDELARNGTLKLGEIGFIWIDCQGSEGLIFKAGKQFLYEAAVPIYIEFWPYGIRQLNCKAEYFEFISQYSSRILKLVDQEMQPISIEFLEDYYSQNLHDKQSLDILILPH